MPLRTIKHAGISGKKVLVRVDFNVPLEGETIRDDTRIRAALPTILQLLEADNAIILVSHLGRPKGKVDTKFTLKSVADHLATLIDAPVSFASDVVGEDAIAKAANLKPGEILASMPRFRRRATASRSTAARSRSLQRRTPRSFPGVAKRLIWSWNRPVASPMPTRRKGTSKVAARRR